MLCTTIEDEPRFSSIIQGWIEDGAVPAFPAFTDEPVRKKKARKRHYEREAMEAEEIGANGSKP